MRKAFVKAKGCQFELDKARFDASGVNCYFLAYCSETSRRKALATAKAMGANVVRCWAFLEAEPYSEGQTAFQYCNKGKVEIHEGPNGLERLDDLICAAEEADLRLILPLVNHWGDLGGMPLYVRWLRPGCEVTEFYRAGAIRAAYQRWVNALLTRRNSVTGRLYSEEPAIMAWELTNEARCAIAGGRELLLDWVEEMSRFVKERDSNHLLALGDEGFFFRKGRGHLYDGSYGLDWKAVLEMNSMDFGTFHFYPQKWACGLELETARGWIQDHAELAATLNKPALMEEYGVAAELSNREWLYGEWQKMVRDSGAAGSLAWMLGDRSPDTAGYVDEYVLYGDSLV